jgi:hypothetical protein
VYSFVIPTKDNPFVGDGFEGTKPFLFSCDTSCQNAFVPPGDRINENGLAVATWLGPSDPPPSATPEPSKYFSDGLWPRGIGVSCEKETLVSAVLLLFLARRRGFALGVESTGPTETDPQAI